MKYLWYIIFIGLLIWAVIESCYYLPSNIAYFNEIAGGPQNGYLHLSDSNVDWGQDSSRVNNYMKEKGYNYQLLTCDETPRYDYYHINHVKMGNKLDPLTNYIAIKIFCFQLPYDSNDPTYQKIKGLKPIDNIGYSIFIYKIK